MNEELNVLQIVAGRLNSAGIPYMLSGSMAANFYTVPRMTRDIDIVVELTGAGAAAFAGLFAPDFYVESEAVERAAAHGGIFNLIHNASVIKVDVITKERSEYQDGAFARKKFFEIGGCVIAVVSPEDLVVSKLRWATDSLSETQLRDVGNILGTVKDIDRRYIEKWVERFGLRQLYDRARI